MSCPCCRFVNGHFTGKALEVLKTVSSWFLFCLAYFVRDWVREQLNSQEQNNNFFLGKKFQWS